MTEAPPFAQQWAEILDHFNWSLVSRTMDTMRDADQSRKVSEVIRRAGKLLEQVHEQGGVATLGGFRAENRNGFLRLSFEISSWDCSP